MIRVYVAVDPGLVVVGRQLPLEELHEVAEHVVAQGVREHDGAIAALDIRHLKRVPDGEGHGRVKRGFERLPGGVGHGRVNRGFKRVPGGEGHGRVNRGKKGE